jgi:hypothetical protein
MFLNDRALVIEDLPAVGGLSPEGRSVGDSIWLNQGVGEEVMVVPNRSAMEVFCLPSVFGWGIDALVLWIFIVFDDCGDDFFAAVVVTLIYRRESINRFRLLLY